MKIVTQLCLFCLVCTSLVANPFGHFSTLINVPVAEDFRPGDIEFGTAISADKDYQYDFDYMLNYSPTDRFKFGMTYLNQDNVVFNIQFISMAPCLSF